jgi:hypothetical protein
MKTVFGLVWVLVITACLPGFRTDAQVTDAQVTEPVAVGPDTFTNARDFRSNSCSSAVTQVLALAQTKEW